MDRVVTALTTTKKGDPVAVWYNRSDTGTVRVAPEVAGSAPASNEGILMWSPRQIWTPRGGHTVAKGHVIDCAPGPHDTVTVAVLDDDTSVSTASLDSDTGFQVWGGAFRHAVSLPVNSNPPPPPEFRDSMLAFDVLGNAVVRLDPTPTSIYKLDESAGKVFALWVVSDRSVVAVCELGLLTLTLSSRTKKLKGRPVMRTLRGKLTSACVEHTDRVGVCAMTFQPDRGGGLELWVLSEKLEKLVRDDRQGKWQPDTVCLRVSRGDTIYTELREPPATIVQHNNNQVRSVAVDRLV